MNSATLVIVHNTEWELQYETLEQLAALKKEIIEELETSHSIRLKLGKTTARRTRQTTQQIR